MKLKEYNRKRKFDDTPEPKGKEVAGHHALKFVVQRHEASHLHYDFRLEMDGVLKSWAVPKGPSMNPSDKRLAMMVEDHPYGYRTFEGKIPEGNYGAGTVEIWDRGTYQPLESTSRKEDEQRLLEELEQGSLKFELHGKKLKGQFALVRMHGRQENAWLLIKHRDEYAEEDYDSEDHLESVTKKHRTSSPKKTAAPKKSNGQKAPAKKKSREIAVAHVVRPMLAMLHDTPFDDPGWLFEVKFDGYRAIANIDHGTIELYSRNAKSFNEDYAPIIATLQTMNHKAILDGEIVVLDEAGRSTFQLLQQYPQKQSKELIYYVFDLLELDGNNLRHLPLIWRKELLKDLLPKDTNVRFSDHVVGQGIAFFEEARGKDFEGIIGKLAGSPYREGVRNEEWLKIKVHHRQEALICGFTETGGARKHVGALILGVYEEGELQHVGNCGSGFDAQSLLQLRRTFEPYIQTESPFGRLVPASMAITWLRPELVCEVEFDGWTEDGIMRHPIFQGLRMDKNPAGIVHERTDTEKETEERILSARRRKLKTGEHEVEINGQMLTLTNPDKVYWPEEGYTKGDVIAYYSKMAEYILPYLKDRPESLNRHPNGIAEKNFFQKDVSDTVPDWIETVEIYSESNSRTIRYLICQNEQTLTYLNNLGCIEVNPWNSRTGSLDYPDYCVLDLDPGENTFDEVVETALAVKDVLDRAGADSYPKTSGATGMHIYIPLGAHYAYDQARDFAHIIARLTHEHLPGLTSLERSPKSRRKQIYIDFLQNSQVQTLSSAYSLRPRPGATVSTPLQWKEVKKGLHPSKFTIQTIHKRVQRIGDIFAGVVGKGINLKKCLKKLGA